MAWKLEQEGDYFRIYGDDKNVAGYLDPDYGLAGQEDDQDKIDRMLKRHDAVPGAFLMVPMVKFSIFDVERLDVRSLQARMVSAADRIATWRALLDDLGNVHWIGISHTDTDMLAVTIGLRFPSPAPLRKEALLEEVKPMLDRLRRLNLL